MTVPTSPPTAAPTSPPSAAPTSPPPHCGQCGEPRAAGTHQACGARAELEPPRYCAACRRRMVVQVTPRGWTARCVEHGTITG